MATIGSRGDKLDLLVRQGATLGPMSVTMRAPSDAPIDLTGCQIRAKIRKSYATAQAIDLHTLITDPAAGAFQFWLTDDQTAAMTCGATPSDPASLYVWDLEIEYGDGTVRPVFYGAVKVAPEATK